jgi:vacuolar-type H+-ATPase subunit F/Vma7
MTGEGVVVVVPAELETGFLLAGVETVATASAGEAVEALDRMLEEGLPGVVAVYEPFLAEAPSERRGVYDASIAPVVVALPAGLEERGVESHCGRISAMLSRAVGYHITFGAEGPR